MECVSFVITIRLRLSSRMNLFFNGIFSPGFKKLSKTKDNNLSSHTEIGPTEVDRLAAQRTPACVFQNTTLHRVLALSATAFGIETHPHCQRS